MRSTRLRSLVLLVLPVALLFVAAAPARTQQATFRSTTSLVQVDAIVLDREDKFVRGLKADDLILLEDGKPQKIEQFYLVTHDPVTRASMIAADEAGHPAEQAHRLFVVMFDEGHLAADSIMRVKGAAENFVMRHIGPGDVAGVFVGNQLHQAKLTTDKGALLSGIRALAPSFETRQTMLAPLRDFPRIESELQAAQLASGNREQLRRTAQEACRRDRFQCEATAAGGDLGQIENLLQQKARLYVRQARMHTSQTMQNIGTMISGLAGFAGRKTLVLVTEGFFMEEERATVQRLGAQAARAGVTIYTIDARGLTMNTGTSDVSAQEAPRTMTFDSGEDGPTLLTATTGGVAVRNLDDMNRAFSNVAADTSTYYVIGYSPTNAKMDGKFRKIEVKTKMSGVKVRSRRGYLATPLPAQESYWR